MPIKEVVIPARMRKGKLQVRLREHHERDLAAMRDGDVFVTVREASATRSAHANAYYWSVIVEYLTRRIKDMSAEEIHEYVLKPTFLSKKGAAIDGNGEIVAEWVIGGSTSRLNVNEFYEYCEEIRRWAAEKLTLDIPDPDVDWRERTERKTA
jgi:hypothetical protein